jgi:hypothetical protein
MRIRPESGGFYRLGGVNSVVVNYLRYSVKSTHRYYDDGVWFVHADFLLPVVQLGYGQFGYVDYSELSLDTQMRIAQEKEHWTMGGGARAPLVRGPSLEESYAALYLIPGAPKAVVVAVWKALAKSSHPDKGGDEAEFKRYSEAYTRIVES